MRRITPSPASAIGSPKGFDTADLGEAKALLDDLATT
jgi:hypothetical protein